MKSLSRIFKSTQVILDEKKYRLTPDITPEIAEEDTAGAEENVSAAPSISDEALHNMMDEAAQQAREITESAKSEADEVIEAAYEQAKGIYEKANSEGYEAGFEKGYEEGRKESEALIDDALQIKNAAVDQYKKLVLGAERELVEIVLGTVEKILNKHVEEDEFVIEGLVKSALEKCAYTEDMVLRVASEDYSYALSFRDRILSLAENVDSIDIKEDKSLSPGSCVVDTVAGSVDSSISTQFEQIKEAFETLLSSE